MKRLCKHLRISKSTVYRHKQFLCFSLTPKGEYVSLQSTIQKEAGQASLVKFFCKKTKKWIIFSPFGTKEKIILNLVKRSRNGYSEAEIEKKTVFRVDTCLKKLMKKKKLIREKTDGVYIFFHPERYNYQRDNRRNKEIKERGVVLLKDILEVFDEERLKGIPGIEKFRTLVSMLFDHNNTYRGICTKLKLDEEFRKTVIGNNEPFSYVSLWNYFNNDLSEWVLRDIAVDLVRELKKEGVITGHYFAIDATHIFANANKKKRDTNKKPIHGAAHGRKSKTFKFYGYKLHIIIDSESELPIAFHITPGNEADSSAIIPLVEFTKEHLEFMKDSFEGTPIFGDSGYDVHDIFLKARRLTGTEVTAPFNPRGCGILKHLKKMFTEYFKKHKVLPGDISEVLAETKQKVLGDFGVKIRKGAIMEQRIFRAIKERVSRSFRVPVERVFSRLKQFLGLNRMRDIKLFNVRMKIILILVCQLGLALAANRKGAEVRSFSKVLT